VLQVKKLIPFLLLSILALLAPTLHAQCGPSTPAFTVSGSTITATTPGASDVQAALNAVSADGTTVAIPSGTCAWTTTVTYNQTFSTAIQGQTTVVGNCSNSSPTCTATDNTIIEDGVNHGGSDPPMLQLNTASGKSLRLTGLSIFQYSGNTSVPFTGIVAVSGSSHLVRIDHNDWNLLNSGSKDINILGWLYGVIDHNYFGATLSPPIVTNDIEFQDPFWNGDSDEGGQGNASWNDVSDFGTGDFMFAENNVVVGGWLNDCTAGGRFVARYNYLGPGSKMQTHGLTTDQHRSCRAMEVYNNSMIYSSNPTTTNFAFMIELEGGTGLFWGNTITGFISFIHEDTVRTNDMTYGPFLAPPNGWGNCGTAQTGISSAWDQNTDSTGHRCLDQVGVGKGDYLTGNGFPNIVDQSTGTVTWPNQASDPVYAWGNTYNAVPQESQDHYWSNTDSVAASNRDYYLELPNFDNSATFNGTAGVGTGTLVPTNSSAYSGAPNCTVQVGYFDTTNQTLYECLTTNTWTAAYTPYTYPHPLVSGSSGPVTLSPSSESFGLFNVGASSSPAPFTVTNNSTTTATSISISDTDSAEFPITNSGAGSCAAAGGSLAANASCTFTVKFSPTSAGVKTPTLSVSYSGGDGASPQTAALSGTGASVTAPAAAIMAILKPDPIPGHARFSVAQ
jgi:hypothetical protein